MEQQPPNGWHGYAPTPPIVVALAGGPVDSALSDERFYLSITALASGFELSIIDWSSESSVESEHATLDAAKQHAANVVNDHALNWEAWTPPGEDSA